jgi:hypothetical protein
MTDVRATVILIASVSTLALTRPAAAADATCNVEITGDTTLTIKAPPPGASDAEKHRVAANSDYWMSEQTIRRGVEAMHSMDGADRQKKIDAQMKADPRIVQLAITCMTNDFTLGFTPTDGSKYADVPMKPKKYKIVPPKGPPGAFEVVGWLMIGAKHPKDKYVVSEPGELDITEFNSKHLAAKFSFKATNTKTPKKITVTGTFVSDCNGDKCGK